LKEAGRFEGSASEDWILINRLLQKLTAVNVTQAFNFGVDLVLKRPGEVFEQRWINEWQRGVGLQIISMDLQARRLSGYLKAMEGFRLAKTLEGIISYSTLGVDKSGCWVCLSFQT